LPRSVRVSTSLLAASTEKQPAASPLKRCVNPCDLAAFCPRFPHLDSRCARDPSPIEIIDSGDLSHPGNELPVDVVTIEMVSIVSSSTPSWPKKGRREPYNPKGSFKGLILASRALRETSGPGIAISGRERDAPGTYVFRKHHRPCGQPAVEGGIELFRPLPAQAGHFMRINATPSDFPLMSTGLATYPVPPQRGQSFGSTLPPHWC
jgi:hypothetical protein